MNDRLIAAITALVLAVPVAVLLWRWLRTHAYRYEDEVDAPHRTHHWVLVALPALAGFTAWAMQHRYPLLVVALYVAVLAPMAALAAIDMDVHRLPDMITYKLLPASLVIVAVSAAAVGDWGRLLRGVLAALALGAIYLVILLAAPGGGFGMGDLKLSPSMGLLLGFFSWNALLVATVVGFVVSGVVSVLWLLLRRVGLKSEIAFGPYMILGYSLAAAVS